MNEALSSEMHPLPAQSRRRCDRSGVPAIPTALTALSLQQDYAGARTPSAASNPAEDVPVAVYLLRTAMSLLEHHAGNEEQELAIALRAVLSEVPVQVHLPGMRRRVQTCAVPERLLALFVKGLLQHAGPAGARVAEQMLACTMYDESRSRVGKVLGRPCTGPLPRMNAGRGG